MSEFKIDEKSGFIFKNKYKTEDKHPMYKGNINWKGELIDIALWVKKDKEGKSFFSAKLNEPFVKPDEAQSNNNVITDKPEEITPDDSLPF